MGAGESRELSDLSAVEGTGRHRRPDDSGALTHDEARHEEHPIRAPLEPSKPGNAVNELDFRVRAIEPPADRGSGEIRALLARLLVRRYLANHTDASKCVAA